MNGSRTTLHQNIFRCARRQTNPHPCHGAVLCVRTHVLRGAARRSVVGLNGRDPRDRSRRTRLESSDTCTDKVGCGVPIVVRRLVGARSHRAIFEPVRCADAVRSVCAHASALCARAVAVSVPADASRTVRACGHAAVPARSIALKARSHHCHRS